MGTSLLELSIGSDFGALEGLRGQSRRKKKGKIRYLEYSAYRLP